MKAHLGPHLNDSEKCQYNILYKKAVTLMFSSFIKRKILKPVLPMFKYSPTIKHV